MPNCYDVSILGGGLAGMTLALQLKKQAPQIKIVVLEKNSFPLPEAAHKVGESTVEIAAHYFSDVLELGAHIKEEQLPKLGLRCFFNTSGSRDLDQRLELGSNSFFPRKTYQIDRGRLENHLALRLAEEKIELLSASRVDEITLGPAKTTHSIKFSREGVSQELLSRWIVDCSGRTALLKRSIPLTEDCPHEINAVWFRLNKKINVDDWCSGDAWTKHNKGPTSRWFSTNHLLGDGYWVWIIPLASGATSFGIVADPRQHALNSFNSFDKAIAWLKKYEPLCGAAVEKEKSHVMDFLALKNYSRWASQVYSSERWALSGDSGVFLDPLYSPGSDYVAISNTFICDLITRELSGKTINAVTQIYNDLLLLFAKNSLYLYQDQYPILGNPVVMPIKILWDFALYWTFMAFLFTHDKLCDVTLYITTREKLEQISRINQEMQMFFRQWSLSSQRQVARSFIDIGQIPYFFELNKSLTTKLDEAQFKAAFISRLEQLSALGVEIATQAQRGNPDLQMPESLKGIMSERFVLQDVFEKLGISDNTSFKQAASA